MVVYMVEVDFLEVNVMMVDLVEVDG